MARRKKRSKKTSSSRRSVLNVTTQSARAQAAPVGLPAGALLLVGALCLLVLGWGLWLCLNWTGDVLFTRNARFNLKNLEARSDGVIPPEVLLDWAELEPGVNLYAVDLAEVQRRVERKPIIRSARIRRDLPDGITLNVNERIPLARLGRTPGGLNHLVSAEGYLIRKSPQQKNLPFIKGVGANLDTGDIISDTLAADALAYLDLLKDFPGTKRALLDVRVISVGHPEYLDWRLGNGYQLLMPRDGDFVQIMERASRLIHLNEEEQLPNRVFDLRPKAANVIGAPE